MTDDATVDGTAGRAELLLCSVVIPVRNGAKDIGEQLGALGAQPEAERIEVVISDNGSTDDTRDVARRFASHFRELVIVDSSEKPGVSYARNVGISAASAPLVLICDSDDIVGDGWLAAMTEALAEYDIAGGPLETASLTPERANRSIEQFDPTRLPTTLRYLPYAFGGNIGFRKTVFDTIGGFDPEYRGHEEVDWCWRAQEAGFSVGLAAQAVLHYRLRGSVGGMVKQRYQFGYSNAQLQAHYQRPGMPPFTLRRQVRTLLEHLSELPAALKGHETDQWRVGLGWSWGRLRGAWDFRDLRPAPSSVNPVALLLAPAKQVKHVAFVGRKRWKVLRRRVRDDVVTRAFFDLAPDTPFDYRPERYRGTFLDRSITPTETSEFPAVVFTHWLGDNPLPEVRQNNLEMMRSKIGLPVVLVSKANLSEWVVEGYPLHPAYEHLSLIHRSDYLRAYLMHHHGGAYIDVKRPLHSWRPSYDRMLADPDAWAMSYSSFSAAWVAKVPGRLGLDIVHRFRSMFCKSGFMMRSHTPLTAEWMAELHARLDARAESLAAHPGGVRGAPGYPMSWHDAGARIVDPLTLKYHEHIRYDDDMLLDFENYL